MLKTILHILVPLGCRVCLSEKLDREFIGQYSKKQIFLIKLKQITDIMEPSQSLACRPKGSYNTFPTPKQADNKSTDSPIRILQEEHNVVIYCAQSAL
jgi:hypothetical protein